MDDREAKVLANSEPDLNVKSSIWLYNITRSKTELEHWAIQAEQRANQAEQRVAQLAEFLRSQGIDPVSEALEEDRI